MKTFELILFPPRSFVPCKWKTARANSIEEFADMCDNDPFLYELFGCGWTISKIKEIEQETRCIK